MSQIVLDEQGIKHVFPDDATPEQITQAMRAAGGITPGSVARHAPMLAEKPSMLSRAFNTINPRIDEAAGGVAQGVGDITDLLQPGFEPALSNVDTFNKLLGINAPPAQWKPGSQVAQEVYNGPDFSRAASQATDINRNSFRAFDGTQMQQPSAAAPQIAPRQMQPIPEPTDRLGRYLQRGFRGATGAALFPGNMQTNAIVGAAGGVTGEGAVDVSGTRGTPAEARMRLLGELIGGVGGGITLGAIRNTPAQLFKQAIEGLTDEQVMAAQRLMDDATARGTRITAAEAVAQVTGRNTLLTAMQRVSEQSRAGGKIFDPMMAERPTANTAAFNQALDDVTPNPATNPATIAPRISEAAGGVVQDATGARSAAVKPYYEAAAPTPVQGGFGASAPVPQPLQDIIDEIDNALNKDIGGVGADSAAGKQLVQFKRDLLSSADSNGYYNVGTLNNLYKTWRDNLTSSPMENPNAVGKTVSGILGRINDRLGSVLESQSSDLAAGNQLYRDISQNVVDPLKQGPVGRLADATTYDTVANTLMPANPKDLTADSIKAAIAQIKLKNPELLPEFVQTNLRAIWNQSTKDLQSGANQWGGAGFAKAVSANAEQEKILQTLIESLPGGQSKWAGFRNFLDIMEAQGKRQFVGSQTDFNRIMNQDLSGTNWSAATKPLGWMSQALERWKYGSNTGEIARVLTDPKGVELLSKLALTKPNSARAATLAAEVMALVRSNESPSAAAK